MRTIRVMGWAVGLCVWAGALCAASPSWAEDEAQLPVGLPYAPRRIQRELPETPTGREMKIGIFEVHPSFRTSVRYDDNVFLDTPDGAEKDDTVFTQTPAIETHVKLGDHKVAVGYGAEIVNFAEQSEENTVNHLAFGQADLVFNDLSLTASHGFEDAASRHFSETSVRDQLQINSTQVTARYDRPKWAAETEWTHNDLNHKDSLLDPNDLQEDLLGFLAGYKFFPDTLFFVEGNVGWVDYDREISNVDQDYYQIFGGVRGEITSKTTVTAKLGYHNRETDDDTLLGPQDDYSGVVSDFRVKFQPRDNTALQAGYSRTVRNSTFESNNFFVRDQLSMGLTQRFMRKWIFSPVVSWQRHTYPDPATRAGETKDRKDDFILVETALRYEMQDWLSTGITYNFRDRDSNLDTFDYENNLVTFDVTSVF